MTHFIENSPTYGHLAAVERGDEVFYQGIRTQVVWKIIKERVLFVVLQNGAVLSMEPFETKPVRTFPAFGEDTRPKF